MVPRTNHVDQVFSASPPLNHRLGQQQVIEDCVGRRDRRTKSIFLLGSLTWIMIHASASDGFGCGYIVYHSSTNSPQDEDVYSSPRSDNLSGLVLGKLSFINLHRSSSGTFDKRLIAARGWLKMSELGRGSSAACFCFSWTIIGCEEAR